MKYLILCTAFMLLGVAKYAQESKVEDNLVFTIVDQKAQFKGGQQALEKYLEQSLQYPKQALKNKTEGTVYVRFVIRDNGEVTSLKILKGIGDNCDQEALRVIGQMPNWEPAIHQGAKVASYYTIPIHFVLKMVPFTEG